MRAIVACGALLVGLVLAASRPTEPVALGLAAAGLVAAAAAIPVGHRARWPTLLLAIAALASVRAALSPLPDADDLTALNGRETTLLGEVVSAPRQQGRLQTFLLEARYELSPPGESRPIQARTEILAWRGQAAEPLSIGDWVEVAGAPRVPEPSAVFPRREILRRQGVLTSIDAASLRLVQPGTRGSILGWGADLRTTLAARFREVLPPPTDALALGILLGGSDGLEPIWRSRMQAAGLGHLVAVSGYNVVVVAGVLGTFATRLLSRRFSAAPSLAAIALYVGIVGAPASAVRAGIMAAAALGAGSVGRIADPLTGVFLAATGMALWDPLVLFDVGFQLSCAATLGVVLLQAPFARLLRRLPAMVAEPLALALAAEVATLPIALVVFQQVSLVGPLANVLAAPLVPLIMATAAVFLLVLPIPWLAPALAPLVWGPTALLALIAQLLGGWTGASLWTGTLPVAAAWLLGAILLLAGVLAEPGLASRRRAWRASLWPPGGRGRLGRMSGAALALAILLAPVARPDENLHVHLLAADEGRVLLVRGPAGGTVLVADRVGDDRGTARLLAQSLPVWEHGLDAVVLLDPSQRAGLSETLGRYPPRQMVEGWQDLGIDLGDGATLETRRGGGVWIAWRHVWLPLAGRPEPPAPAAAWGAVQLEPGPWPPGHPPAMLRIGPADGEANTVRQPVEGRLEVVSNGVDVWVANGPSLAGDGP